MKDWRKVLESERNASGKVYTLGCPRPIHLGNYYRGKFFARELCMTSECVYRVQALDFVLSELPVNFDPAQIFYGGAESYQLFELPAQITRDDYQWHSGVAAGRGGRNFSVGVDHTVADYPTLLREGLDGMLSRIARSRQEHPGSAELEAMEIAVRAVAKYCRRVATAIRPLDAEAAARMERIAGAAPESFADALQLVWLVFVVLESEGRSHMALGRFDQYLIDFYRRDLAGGAISRTDALEMICHIWTKIEGIHEVTNICIGGLTPSGADAVNELSFLALEATRLTHSPSTNLSARFHAGTSDEFQLACIDVIRTGIGFPAIFNDEVTVPMLEHLGVAPEYARDYCMVGCVETVLAGRQQAWSDGRFDMHLCADRVIDRLEAFTDFEELFTAFTVEVTAELERYCQTYNRMLSAFPPERYPDPLLSAFTCDCIGRGKDLNGGGAQFPRYHGIAMMGLGTVADSFAAIRKWVFDERKITPAELLQALRDDFTGHEKIHHMLKCASPKYGNDDDAADMIAQRIVSFCGTETLKFRTADGGRFQSCMAANVSNIPAGKLLKATPDGRKAWTPLSDAASPYFGCDLNGPTAFVSSICKPDYSQQNCTVVNMRFLPEFFSGEDGRQRMLAFTKEFVRRGGHEMQFNVTDNRTLTAALQDPDRFQDLVVRVSGFSAYFTRLEKEVQLDVMRRLAHG